MKISLSNVTISGLLPGEFTGTEWHGGLAHGGLKESDAVGALTVL